MNTNNQGSYTLHISLDRDDHNVFVFLYSGVEFKVQYINECAYRTQYIESIILLKVARFYEYP